MRLFRRKRVKAGLVQAREAREAAEERLAHTRETLIIPLRSMHKENHIAPLINSLIRRRAAERRG